jgi:hypothetical protein
LRRLAVFCAVAAGISLVCVIVVAVTLLGTRQQVETNTGRSLDNQQGFRILCYLIAEQTRQSGFTVPTGPAERQTDQQRLSMLIADALPRLLTPSERKEAVILQERIRRAGGGLRVPDCERIIRHPETVRTQTMP